MYCNLLFLVRFSAQGGGELTTSLGFGAVSGALDEDEDEDTYCVE